MSMRPMD
ncbi:hypothetical protein AYI68_g5319, partial [Smittium mucronatum]